MRAALRSRRAASRVSAVLVLSYVVDWLVVIVTVLAARFFDYATPNKRPFSVANPDISFPYKTKETVTSTTLVLTAVVAPAVIIVLVVLVCIPGPTSTPSIPKSLIWQRKLWEWFTGWTGLALSLAVTVFITNGIKNLCGHWRPDLLARCQPDITNLQSYAVGGYPDTTQGAYLVSDAACQATDSDVLNDGFKSFPSGHASISAAGLIYLSFFLASKFAIAPPSLAQRASESSFCEYGAFPSRKGPSRTGLGQGLKLASEKNKLSTDTGSNARLSGHGDAEIAARNQSAAPPLYLLAIVCIPFFTAIFISCSRYFDFRHHGFDILSGFFLGTVLAIFSFRWYHLPISKGAGWSWAQRSRDHAFWAGVGVGNYARLRYRGYSEPESGTGESGKDDLEAGPGVQPVQSGGLLESPNR